MELITLPRGKNIDIDDVPDNLEEMVQASFAEYTRGTRAEYMYQDKLCYIDNMIRRLHSADEVDKVNELIKDAFAYGLEEQGEFMDESEVLSIEFMQQCYEQGLNDAKMYSHNFGKRKHDDDKIMKIICRVIKAVMDYEWGKDGV